MNDLEAGHQIRCFSHLISKGFWPLLCFDDMEASGVNLESRCSRAFTVEQRGANRPHL